MTAVRKHLHLARAMPLILLASLQSCATTGHVGRSASDTSGRFYDPLQPVNRKIFSFNMGLYDRVLEPAAKGYRAVTPPPLRDGIAQFFANASYPYVLLNDFLQGRIHQGLSDAGRFIVNTVFGVAGLIDVASQVGLPAHKNSLGVTLGVWGVPQGAYLVVPFFGPSSVRNLPGIPLEIVMSPFYYMTHSAVQWGVSGVGAISTANAQRGNVRTVQESASPYFFARNAWEQHERYLVQGRNVTHEELLDGLGPVLNGPNSAPPAHQRR
ncbi:MAG: MlaA family lipoprotein [Acidimicrobiales bacterium]